MDRRRARLLRDGAVSPGPVICWMSREQRVRDNWTLLFAQELALERQAPLAVIFCLAPSFLGATFRQYGFMLRGLEETAALLSDHAIPFFLLRGEPVQEIPAFLDRERASLLVTDFDPLRIKRRWRQEVAVRCSIPVWEVDGHNIVPCWLASSKLEYSAATLRPKLRRLLPEFLTDFPSLLRHPFPWPGTASPVDWQTARDTLACDRTVPEVARIEPGEAAVRAAMDSFLDHGLSAYHERRNDPSVDGQSGLSPYLHFGQLAPQRLALETSRMAGSSGAGEVFLEELVVRRELSDNFCLYNDAYDSVAGFPSWARKTLDDHRRDSRPYRYSSEELERGGTHDPLWNAAQLEVVATGRMHGYLRMYWAKKILEWSATPEEALATAIRLNDRYQLDGRDPNGYAGIAWSIGGVHDRPWGARPVYGMVRCMTLAGCQRKFSVERYVQRVAELAGENFG